MNGEIRNVSSVSLQLYSSSSSKSTNAHKADNHACDKRGERVEDRSQPRTQTIHDYRGLFREALS